MSTKAVSWAYSQIVLSPVDKFVLVVFADHFSDTNKTYPSIQTVMQMTGIQHPDTVARAIKSLIAQGFMRDTGKRLGATGKVKVYEFPSFGNDLAQRSLNTPNNLTITSQSPNPAFDLTIRELGTIRTVAGATAVSLPVNLAQHQEFRDAWVGWLEERKTRRVPITPRAAQIQLKLLSTLGPAKAILSIEQSISNGWRGLFPPQEEKRVNGYGHRETKRFEIGDGNL